MKTMTVEKITYDGINFITKPDPLDYESTNRGSLIDYPCWKKIIDDYWMAPPSTENSMVVHIFSKQILSFLLSLEDCIGLLMTKCINPKTKKESMAICAIDENLNPLGHTTGNQQKFAGGEWGLTISFKKFESAYVKTHTETQEKYVDIESFLADLSKLDFRGK